MFFNGIYRELEVRREVRGDRLSEYTELVFADDVTTITTAAERDLLRGRARVNVQNVRNSMRARGLEIQDPKTHNIRFLSELLQMGVFRRVPKISDQIRLYSTNS